MLYIFSLCLSARPFLGLVGKVASTSIFLQPPSGAAGICPLVFYIVTSFIVQHLDYLLFLYYQKCPICKVSWRLCSVLESPSDGLMSRLFRRGFQNGLVNLLSFLCNLACLIQWYIFSVLCCCHQVASLLQPLYPFNYLVGFLSIIYLCQRGSKILGGTDPRLREMYG